MSRLIVALNGLGGNTSVSALPQTRSVPLMDAYAPPCYMAIPVVVISVPAENATALPLSRTH